MESRKKVEQLSSVANPQKVKVLILGDQKSMYSDFYFLTRFANIIKLDLSYNKISAFPIGFSFKSFPHIRTLFLHYNKFNNLKALQPVSQTIRLQYITLFGNPLQQTKTRHYMINQIQSLIMMDETVVKMQQRLIDILPLASVNSKKEINSKITYPIVTVLQSEGSEGFLAAVIKQLTIIRKKYMEVNSILKIQRWIKHILKKKKLDKLKMIQEAINMNNQNNNNRLQTDPQQRQQRHKILNNRLITQKFQVSKSNQEKVVSIFKMNLQFFSILRAKAQQGIFSERSYCQKHKIKYQSIDSQYYCLRLSRFINTTNKSFLQFILKVSQQYLIRRKGKNKGKYSTKQSIRNRKHLKNQRVSLVDNQPNLQLTKKLNQIEQQYQCQLVKITQPVDVKFHLLKQSYMKAKSEGASVIIQQTFPFCLQQIVDRTVAAISIQRLWRGYHIRKHINAKTIIKRNFAAIKIQRWVRSLASIHRSHFFSEFREVIKKDNTKSIIITAEQVIKLQKKHMQNLNGINLVLDDQKFSFQIRKQSQSFTNSIDIRLCHYYSHRPMIIPGYIKQILRYSDLKNNSAKINVFQSNSKRQNQQTKHKALQNINIAQILFSQAQSTEYWSQKSKKQMVKFCYRTIQQARTRKFLLALVTYNFKHKSFVKNIQSDILGTVVDVKAEINNKYFISIQGRQPQQKIIMHKLSDHVALSMKVKLFIHQKDLTEKIKIYIPKINQINQEVRLRDEVKNWKQISESVANIKSMAASSVRLEDQVDRCNNYKVGLKINIDNIHNNIMKLNLNNQSQGQQNKGSQSKYTSSHILPNSRAIHQQRKRKKIKLQTISRYQNLDTLQQQQNYSIKDHQRRLLNYKSLKAHHLEKSQSLKPKKNNHDISLNIQQSHALQKQLMNADRKNLNTQLVYFSARNNHNFNQSSFQSLSNLNQKLVPKQIDLTQCLQSIDKQKKIQQLRQSHRQKLQHNLLKKQAYLNKIKQQMNQQAQNNRNIIKNNKDIVSNQVTERHDRIRAMLQNKRHQSARYSPNNSHDKSVAQSIEASSPRQKFESQFVKKGNRSMKIEMMKFEKNRQFQLVELQTTKNYARSIKNSSQGGLDSSQVSKSMIKKQPFILKTQIKQFSIEMDNSLAGQYNLANDQFSKQYPQKFKLAANNVKISASKPIKSSQSKYKQKKSDQPKIMQKKQPKFQSKKLMKQSNTPVNNTNNSNQAQQPFGKKISADVHFNVYQSQLLDNSSIDYNNKSTPKEIKSRSDSKNKNKLRKIVHSVFPQQFYPLQQNNKLGFHLPKLSKHS